MKTAEVKTIGINNKVENKADNAGNSNSPAKANNCLQLDEINSLNLKVAKKDDFEISLAGNMLKSVIDNNGQTMD